MADSLKTLIEGAGLTLERAGSTLALHPALLQRIVNGRQPLPIGLARQLAALTGQALGTVLASVPRFTRHNDALLYRPVPPDQLRGDPVRIAPIGMTQPVRVINPPLILGAR